MIGIVYVYLPFMVLPLYATLERLDRSYLEASLDLGAGQWRTFRSVVVPLARPGIISGVILVFVPALGTFLISDLLGGPDSQLIGNVIERQFKAANNWPLGAAHVVPSDVPDLRRARRARLPGRARRLSRSGAGLAAGGLRAPLAGIAALVAVLGSRGVIGMF